MTVHSEHSCRELCIEMPSLLCTLGVVSDHELTCSVIHAELSLHIQDAHSKE